MSLQVKPRLIKGHVGQIIRGMHYYDASMQQVIRAACCQTAKKLSAPGLRTDFSRSLESKTLVSTLHDSEQD